MTRTKLIPSALISALLLLTSTSPIASTPLTTRQTTAISEILQIAPTSNTCSNAAFPSECATASQAAPYLISAFQNYSITSPSQMAAVLSLQAFETGDFKYNINHYPSPGRPGQGTRNMQMASYNLLYAKSIPALVPAVEAITTSTSVDGLSDEQLNGIRALVLPDEYCWGSGAWFLTSQCGEDVLSAMETPGEEGFEAYMGCVGTTATNDRLAYYNRALQAFGLS